MKLNTIRKKYYDVLNSKASKKEKNKKLADLMTELEIEFNIPFFKDCTKYKLVPKEVIRLYEEISINRDFAVY